MTTSGERVPVDKRRKPFTLRERRAWPQHVFGWRPTTNWGSGDLPAPWAAGDVVLLTGERHERLDDLTGPHFVVDTAFSIGEGDAWYFRVADGTRFGGHVQSSGRLHVIPPDTDWMSCFELVETADPEGLALREQMLADGWSYTPPPTCEACGQRLPQSVLTGGDVRVEGEHS